jgi:hypothetical protein
MIAVMKPLRDKPRRPQPRQVAVGLANSRPYVTIFGKSQEVLAGLDFNADGKPVATLSTASGELFEVSLSDGGQVTSKSLGQSEPREPFSDNAPSLSWSITHGSLEFQATVDPSGRPTIHLLEGGKRVGMLGHAKHPDDGRNVTSLVVFDNVGKPAAALHYDAGKTGINIYNGSIPAATLNLYPPKQGS